MTTQENQNIPKIWNKQMRLFYGTQAVSAQPMTLGAYNSYRGWELTEDQDSETPGFLVEELNSTVKNDLRHRGYITWMHADKFRAQFQSLDQLSFSHALEALKNKLMVARKGWNGKNMFLFLVQGSTFQVNREPLQSILGEGTQVNYHGHIDMKTADGTVVPWVASQTDLLANDWMVVVPAQKQESLGQKREPGPISANEQQAHLDQLSGHPV